MLRSDPNLGSLLLNRIGLVGIEMGLDKICWDQNGMIMGTKKTIPLLYYLVQRGYALGDSQEYSKGFDRRLKNR